MKARDDLIDYKRALPTCKKHRPGGGARAKCVICAMIEYVHALSEISHAITGDTVSRFDIDHDLGRLVKDVKRTLKQLGYRPRSKQIED